MPNLSINSKSYSSVLEFASLRSLDLSILMLCYVEAIFTKSHNIIYSFGVLGNGDTVSRVGSILGRPKSVVSHLSGAAKLQKRLASLDYTRETIHEANEEKPYQV